MRNIVAMLFKELRVVFTTPVAYVAYTVFTLVSSFFFLRLLSAFQRRVVEASQMRPQDLRYINFTDGVLQPLFYDVAVIFVFIVPFLTMRLIAEERRGNTFELLMANPISPAQITLGKYLAALVQIAVMVLLVGIYPLLVDAYAIEGGPEWASVATGMLGLFLLGAAFCAVGLFISALTDSQVVAAAITFCALLLLWVVGWAAADNSGATREVLEAMSAIEHIRSFTRGVIDLQDTVYYLSLAGLGLFMTRQALEAARFR